MTLAHPIPAAIDGLIALWATHPDLRYTVNRQTVQMRVIDGPPLDATDEPRILFVGVSSQAITAANSPAADTRTGFGHGGRRTDMFEVACGLSVWSGDTDLAAERTTAFEVLETLHRILTADRTLSRLVDWARITHANYQPAQSEDGAGVSIDFAVQVAATRFEGV